MRRTAAMRGGDDCVRRTSPQARRRPLATDRAGCSARYAACVSVRVALRVVSLESRRGGELARLLERHGLSAIAAPSLREVPLSEQRDALAFGRALLAGECDVLVLLTGVGARALVDALASEQSREQVLAAL